MTSKRTSLGRGGGQTRNVGTGLIGFDAISTFTSMVSFDETGSPSTK
jgi:hypothetical protein